MADFTVEQGKRYRATVALSGIESFAGNGMIADKLAEAGFSDVSVTGAGQTRVAVATWGGETKSGPLPSRVVSIEEVA